MVVYETEIKRMSLFGKEEVGQIKCVKYSGSYKSTTVNPTCNLHAPLSSAMLDKEGNSLKVIVLVDRQLKPELLLLVVGSECFRGAFAVMRKRAFVKSVPFRYSLCLSTKLEIHWISRGERLTPFFQTTALILHGILKGSRRYFRFRLNTHTTTILRLVVIYFRLVTFSYRRCSKEINSDPKSARNR